MGGGLVMLKIEIIDSTEIEIIKKLSQCKLFLSILVEDKRLKTKSLCLGDVSRRTYERLVNPEIYKIKDGYIILSSIVNIKIKTDNEIIKDYQVLNPAEVKSFKSNLPKKQHSYLKMGILANREVVV